MNQEETMTIEEEAPKAYCNYCSREADSIMKFGEQKGAIIQLVCSQHLSEHLDGKQGHMIKHHSVSLIEAALQGGMLDPEEEETEEE